MLLLYLALFDNTDDSDKFETLYVNYKERMMRIADGILHNLHDSEDAVHNAFLSIANNIKKINDPNSLEAMGYVCRASKNAALNSLTKRNRRTDKEYTLPDEDLYGVEDNDLLNVCSEDNIAYIVSCIKALPDTYRDVLYLFYVDELTAREIAVKFNMKKATVKQRLVRGKKMLLNLLSKEEYSTK